MAGFPPPSVVDLSLSRAQVSPQDTFTDLADQCTALGITKQDVYGDFSAPEGSSWLDRFETELSEALGKKKGMFLPSGGMAQSIALLVHLKAAEQGKCCSQYDVLARAKFGIYYLMMTVTFIFSVSITH